MLLLRISLLSLVRVSLVRVRVGGLNALLLSTERGPATPAVAVAGVDAGAGAAAASVEVGIGCIPVYVLVCAFVVGCVGRVALLAADVTKVEELEVDSCTSAMMSRPTNLYCSNATRGLRSVSPSPSPSSSGAVRVTSSGDSRGAGTKLPSSLKMKL